MDRRTAVFGMPLLAALPSALLAAEPIPIGAIVPLTGPYGPLGAESLAGMQVAADAINKDGGIGGRPIELLVVDDKSAPDQSVIGFKSLAGRNVVGVLGSLFSNSAVATFPLAEAAKVPYIGAAVADEQIDPVKDFIFISSIPMRPVAEAILGYLASEKRGKLSVVYDSKNAFSLSGWKHMKAQAAKHGVELVLEEPVASTASDFSSVFVRMRSRPADAVMFWGIGSGAIAFTKQYQASGLKAALVMSTAQASVNRYVQPCGAAAEGVVVASLLADIGAKLPPSPVKAAFDRLAVPYKAKTGSEFSGFAAGGAAALQLMAEAVRKGGTDRQKVQQALATMKLTTPLGVHQHSRTQHYGLGPENVAINKVGNGDFVPTPWTQAKLARLQGT